MKFAIIAAGEGSRLAKEGIKTPKPLITIQGVPIIERLVKIFADNGAGSIGIIINEQQPETLALLQSLQKNYPIDIVVKDTPSSMHSMHALLPYLQGEEKFCLTTVDTLFKEDEFKHYIEALKRCDNDGIMAVTNFIDDEKPLYIGTDDKMNITAFCDTAEKDCSFISGGIYGLTSKALVTLQKCIDRGESRMRNFQRALIADGCKLKAYPFGKIIDIDHAEDIKKVEIFFLQK